MSRLQKLKIRMRHGPTPPVEASIPGRQVRVLASGLPEERRQAPPVNSEIRLLHFCSIRLLKNGTFRNARILYRQNEIG
jgi:hypothetical protein